MAEKINHLYDMYNIRRIKTQKKSVGYSLKELNTIVSSTKEIDSLTQKIDKANTSYDKIWSLGYKKLSVDASSEIKRLEIEMAEQNKIVHSKEQVLIARTKYRSDLIQADKRLVQSIAQERAIHAGKPGEEHTYDEDIGINRIFDEELPPETQENDFSITATGNFFSTESDKAAFGIYGVQTVEMENRLFVEIMRHMRTSAAMANKVFVDKVYITKIAADPLKIEEKITQDLNEWAKNATMTLDDYIEAFNWANQGQSFANFPDSGRWTIAEKLSKDPLLATRFYSFGAVGELKIVNPFWKEIGTDLVKEISNGSAFKGTAFDDIEDTSFNARKKQLQRMATDIMSDSKAVDVNDKVRDLFERYLKLKPMQVDREEDLASEKPKNYRVYARQIPVLKTGFVTDGVSDWDQLIYKSSNTALLDVQSADFIHSKQGRTYVDSKALMIASGPKRQPQESASLVYVKMLRLFKKGCLHDAHSLGKRFLEKNQLEKPASNVFFRSEVAPTKKETINLDASRDGIKRLLHSISSFPKILHQYGINERKKRQISGPSVAIAIENISKDKGPLMALQTAEQFLIWCKRADKHYVVTDIHSKLPELRDNIEFIDKTKGLIEKSPSESTSRKEDYHRIKKGVADIRQKETSAELSRLKGPGSSTEE